MKMTVSGIDAIIAEIKKKQADIRHQAKVGVATTVIERLKQNTPVDTGNARDGWRMKENGDIVNDVDYIGELNGGHSAQAPAHFVEKTILACPEVKPNGLIVTYTD